MLTVCDDIWCIVIVIEVREWCHTSNYAIFCWTYMLVVLDNFKEVSVKSCCVLLYVFQGNILFFIYLSPSQYVMISKIIHENNNSKCKMFKKKNPINT